MFQKQPPEVFYKKSFSEKNSPNSQKNTCVDMDVSAYNFIKKEALAQVFSYEFYEMFKNTFF